MKTPTNKLSVQSAFSLVELLVVIAVIAVIAAIAIPNIAGITGNAKVASYMRNAQNLSSLSAAAIAAGANATQMTADPIAVLTAGNLTVITGNQTFGPFRADGVPVDAASVTEIKKYLSIDPTTHGLIYVPTGAGTYP